MASARSAAAGPLPDAPGPAGSAARLFSRRRRRGGPGRRPPRRWPAPVPAAASRRRAAPAPAGRLPARSSSHDASAITAGSGCLPAGSAWLVAASTCGSSTAHRGQSCGAPMICAGRIGAQQPQRHRQRIHRRPGPARQPSADTSPGVSRGRAGCCRGRGWWPARAGAAAARPGSAWPGSSRPVTAMASVKASRSAAAADSGSGSRSAWAVNRSSGIGSGAR